MLCGESFQGKDRHDASWQSQRVTPRNNWWVRGSTQKCLIYLRPVAKHQIIGRFVAAVTETGAVQMSSLGKEGRARQARLAVAVNGKVTAAAAAGRNSHRAAGGAPRVVDPTHKAVVEYLETLEQRSVWCGVYQPSWLVCCP